MRGRKTKDIFCRLLLWCFGIVCALTLISAAAVMIALGTKSFSPALLLSRPSVINKTGGLLPQITNTVFICLSGLAIAMPAGAMCALYLMLYAKKKTALVLKTLLGALMAVPTAVYGLFGFFLFSRLFALRWCVASGVLTIALLLFSTAATMSLSALSAADEKASLSALALGATELEMVRSILLRSSWRGLCSAAVLCFSRAAGESAALLLTCGTGAAMPDNGLARYLMSSGATLAVGIYQSVLEGELDMAFSSALVLMATAFLCDTAAALLALKKRR